MKAELIKNFSEIATTPNRKMALEIVEAGLREINTERVVEESIKLEGNSLKVHNYFFDLHNFKKIKVVGFGKASCDAALALEKILGSKIEQSAVIGLHETACDFIQTFAGTHPRPSQRNVEVGEKIYKIVENSTKEDLIIVLVSGGGSALLCYGEDELRQNIALYNELLEQGNTITEINTVRKHISVLKGGGLAKLAYPATVIGLIFSDIPGNHFENVASGPTYKDSSTINGAEKVIEKYDLGKFDLLETPKEDKYFERVHNFVLVSNEIAVKAMAQKAEEFNLQVNIVSTELYDETRNAVAKIFAQKKENSVVLAAGEPGVKVPDKGGKGGRNLHMGLQAVRAQMADRQEFNNSVFISFASDGMDNSDVAGAVVDKTTIEKIEKSGLDVLDYLARCDSYPVFQQSGDAIITGPTGANVSDLMILLTK